MSHAIELLKAKQATLSAEAAAKKAKEELWSQEQVRQLEPIKIALREIAQAEPAIVVQQGSGPVPFRESDKYGSTLAVSERQVSLAMGSESRFVCTYQKPDDECPACHFRVKDESRYGRKACRTSDPIEAIEYLVTMIAEFTR